MKLERQGRARGKSSPEESRVRKHVLRKGKLQTQWVGMRKGVAYLLCYREVSAQANGRYLDALAGVDNPSEAKRALERVTTPKQDAAGRRCAGFNPLARAELALFQSVMDGEHCLKGFTNRDIRAQLQSRRALQPSGHDPRKQSAKVSRIFRRCHAHGLIAKIPHTRRWRVTGYGRQVMGTSLYLHEHHFPNAYATIAA